VSKWEGRHKLDIAFFTNCKEQRYPRKNVLSKDEVVIIHRRDHSFP